MLPKYVCCLQQLKQNGEFDFFSILRDGLSHWIPDLLGIHYVVQADLECLSAIPPGTEVGSVKSCSFLMMQRSGGRQNRLTLSTISPM